MNQSSRSRNNFILQGGILAVAGIIVRLIGLVKRIPLTNIIGDEGNGYYATAYEIYAIILLLSSYSLPLAISKLVSARVSKGQYHNANRIFKGSLLFATSVGLLSSILVFFLSDFLAGSIVFEPMSAIALQMLAPALFIVAIMGVFRGYFQGLGTMMPTAVSQIIEQIFLVIASLSGAIILSNYGAKVGDLIGNDKYKAAYGAAGGTIGCSVGAIIGLAFLVFVFFLYSPKYKMQIKKDQTKSNESYKTIIKILILTIVPVILSTAVYNFVTIINQRIFNEAMIIRGFEEIKTAHWGIFTGKYRVLINIPIALASAMSASTIPLLVNYMENNNFTQAKSKIQTVIRVTMIVSIPCAIGLGVLARPILDLLFNGEIDMAVNMLHLGSISIIFYSLSTLTNGILQGINKLRIPVRNSFISLFVEMIFLYIILRTTNIGIYGVIVANILFSALMCILNSFAISKYLHYKQEIYKAFIIPTVSSLIMGFLVYLVYQVFAVFSGYFVITCVGLFVGATSYFLIMILLKGISERELQIIPFGKQIIRLLKRVHLLKNEG